MKKTLVALAALAATGAFAQAAITGNVTYGYSQSTKSDALASGFGVDTAEVYFDAKEDLGGGWAADAKLGLSDTTRAGVSGGNVVLGLTTGAGKFVFATTKGADYLSGGISGVAGIGFDGKVFSNRSVRDTVSYIVPISSFTLTLSHQEADANSGAALDATKLGLGAGAAGEQTLVGQRLNVIGFGYASGALAANLQYLSYDNRTDNSATSTKDALRAQFSYDLGAAKIGAGYSQATRTNSGTIKDALVGVSVPMGAATFGIQWGQRKIDSVAAASDGTINGVGLTGAYALSKRTSASLTVRNWDSAAQAPKANNQVDLLLSHSF